MSNTSLTTKVSQSRGWTLILGIAAAVLAAILLVAYLVQYRSSVNDSTAPTPVLVAKNLIPKGTSGTVIAEKQLFQAATLSKDDLKVGAISDPAYLNGRVAVADIFPGQQITTADLSCRPHRRDSHAALREAARRRPSRQRPAQPRRLRRERRPRRRVLRDGLGRGHNVLGLLAPNVLVMRAPAADGQPVVLRADAAPCTDARARIGLGNHVVPPPARRRCQERPEEGHHQRSAAPVDHSGQAVGTMERSIRASSPSKDWTSSTSSGRCPTTRSSSSSGSPTAVDDTVRRFRAREVDVLARRMPGQRGRSVAADHRQRPPDGSGSADHRPLHVVAQRLPASGVRRRSRRHGAVPPDEGAAPVRHEQGDRAGTAERRSRRARASETAVSSASSARRAARARR